MWLLEPEIFKAMQRATEAGIQPTAEQQGTFMAAAFDGASESTPRILTVVGNTAEIAIVGVMTQAPDFMAWLFGGGNTTYPEIVSAISLAEQNPEVTKIRYAVDSGGGQFDGLFEVLNAMQRAEKPTESVVRSMAASAAFAVVSQTDTIQATTRATRFGSIGVAAGFRVDESIIEFASTMAPKKRPDVTTAEGKAMVVEELDAMHALFVETIAAGRGTSVEGVNRDFGEGGTLLADESLARGMIDSIAGSPQSKKPASTRGATKQGAQTMTPKEILAQFPSAYNAIIALGKEQGVAQERDNVVAHLIAGESLGSMPTAIAAIKEGQPMTATLTATYMAAGVNRKTTADRVADDVDTDDVDASDNLDVDADVVASAVESHLGIGGAQ